MSTVRKAVFPVAGLGTRFLPATKTVPKEMLPVLERPLIQYAVDEAIEAGIDHLILVTRGDKQSIADYFGPAPDLLGSLRASGKEQVADMLDQLLPSGICLETVVQTEPLGLGHAVWCARDLIGNDAAFAVILPDDLVQSSGPGALKQLVNLHAQTGSSVIGVEPIAPHLTERYGVAAVEQNRQGNNRITRLVEKPDPADAPSNLGVVGRYVLDARILDILATQQQGAGGEIQLTDAIARLMLEREVLALAFQGTRYDCGNRWGLLQAGIGHALESDELREPLLDYIRDLVERESS